MSDNGEYECLEVENAAEAALLTIVPQKSRHLYETCYNSFETWAKEKGSEDCWSARDVLWYLVFTGFAVNFMICFNLNIAIISMVKPPPKNNVSSTSECLTENATLLESVFFNSTQGIQNISTTEPTDFSTQESVTNIYKNDSTNLSVSFFPKLKQFDWDEKLQNNILGSFFWLHWTTQLPGSILAAKYGSRMVFGLSNFISALCCFFIPVCASKGPGFLMFVRILQGLVAGFSWPAIHNLTAKWTPPNERNKFVTAYLGSSIGAVLTYVISSQVTDRWGWEIVFYASGVLGTVWFFAWGGLVYDSPEEHPRISEEEKKIIRTSLEDSGVDVTNELPVPWAKILGSSSVLVNILALCGGIFGFFTLMTHAPTYFKVIHEWNIKVIGVFSGMPHFFSMLSAFLFSQLEDYLLTYNKMSKTNVRKLATAVCCIIQGGFMLALAYSGCNYKMAILFLTLAVASQGGLSTGPMASIVDISPNFASIIFGICGTFVAMMGFLTPIVVDQFTFENQTVEQWQKVFQIAAAILLATGAIYVLFAKSELESWNSPERPQRQRQPEIELLVTRNENQQRAV